MSTSSVNQLQPGTPLTQELPVKEVKKRDWVLVTYIALAVLSLIVFITLPILMAKGYFGSGEYGETKALYGVLGMGGSLVTLILFSWAAIHRHFA